MSRPQDRERSLFFSFFIIYAACGFVLYNEPVL